MRLRISIRGRVHPSVGTSVCRSVPCYFWTPNIVVFEGEKSLTDIINNATMSDDEVVASFGPPRSLFLSNSIENIRASYAERCMRNDRWDGTLKRTTTRKSIRARLVVKVRNNLSWSMIIFIFSLGSCNISINSYPTLYFSFVQTGTSQRTHRVNSSRAKVSLRVSWVVIFQSSLAYEFHFVHSGISAG